MDNKDKINELEIELDYETQSHLYWKREAEYWHREYIYLRNAWNLQCNQFNRLKYRVKEWDQTIK